MGSFNQYYTGADVPYFPPPNQGGKSGVRGVGRLIAAGAMVAIATLFAVLLFFWQAPGANPTPAEAPALKRTIPAAHLAFAIQQPAIVQPDMRQPLIKQGKRRRGQAAPVTGESAATQTDPLELPRDPQIQKMILDSPLLVAPFPTENNIQAGTPRAHLIRTFGKPDLKARTMQQEQLVEIYVYEQPDRSTFVRMQDGSVVSAHTARAPRVRVLPSEPDPDF